MNAIETSAPPDEHASVVTDSSAGATWRRHAFGVAVALFFAAVLVMPRWYLLTTDPPTGTRVQINMFGASGIGLDEGLYGALIRDAYDGELPIRDPFLEAEDAAAPQTGTLWDIVIGGLGHTLGGNGWSVAFVTTAAAVAAFVVFYLLAFRITGSTLAAVAAMAIALVALYVIHRSPGFLALRHWEVLGPLLRLDPQHEVHIWSRFLAPAMPLPLFFGFVLLIPGAVQHRRTPHLFAAGVLFGLLIYTYLFFWFSLGLALAGWMAWLFIRRERHEAMRIVLVGAIAIAIALPELLLVANNGLTLDDDVQARVGAYGGLGFHWDWISPVIQRLVLGAPLIWLAAHGPRINSFYIALYLAPLLPAATTDWLPQTDHFLFQAWPVFAIPLVLAAGAEAYRFMPESVRPAATVAVMTVAAISALYFTTMQVRAMDEIDETYAMPDDEYAVFRWIEDNLSQSDTVVTSSWITNQQLAALTPASTYLADGFITRVSTEELADRYLRVSATYGIDEEVAFYRIDPERDVPTSNKDVSDPELERYYDEAMVYYLFNEGIRQPSQLVDRFPDWRRKYADLTAGSGVLRAYEADYLYCGHRERFWEPSSVAPGTWVQEAYRSGDAVLYRLAPDASDGAVEFEGCARP